MERPAMPPADTPEPLMHPYFTEAIARDRRVHALAAGERQGLLARARRSSPSRTRPIPPAPTVTDDRKELAPCIPPLSRRTIPG